MATKAYNNVIKAVQAQVVQKNARANVQKYVPYIASALKKEGILTPKVLAYALGTILHETGGQFAPIKEFGGPQQAKKLGYGGGANYYGRGFIQLTHDSNYRTFGQRIGMGDALVKNPDLALDPDVASRVLAAFFKDRGVARMADKGDFVDARVPVQGSYNRASTVAKYSNNFLKGLEPALQGDETDGSTISAPPPTPSYNVGNPQRQAAVQPRIRVPQTPTYQPQQAQPYRQPARTFGHTYTTPPQSVPDFFSRVGQTVGDLGSWAGSMFGGGR